MSACTYDCIRVCLCLCYVHLAYACVCVCVCISVYSVSKCDVSTCFGVFCCVNGSIIYLTTPRYNEDDIDLLFQLLRVYNTRQVLSLHFLSRFLENSVIKVNNIAILLALKSIVLFFRILRCLTKEKYSSSLLKCSRTCITYKNSKQKFYNI